MKKYKVGYTQGTFDMFHIGHLNLINNAKQYCDYLIVGVNADVLVEQYKNKVPVVNEQERMTIVENLKAVDEAAVVTSLDKVVAWEQFHFDAIFIGDDWKGNARWSDTEIELQKYGAEVVFLPHTDGISSTILRLEKDSAIDE